MPQAQNYAELLARYQRMRAACSRLNNDLLPEYLSREAMMRAAKRLGFWHDGTLVMDQDSERAVLMDYALHDCLLDGVSTVDLFAEAEPPVPGSDEETVLAAKQRAFYGVLKIKEVVPGVGVHVSEVLREQS